jgi:hypothetical protein
MNSTFQILSICFLSLICIQTTPAQTTSKEHSFKITGKTRLPDTADPSVDCLVEYDTTSIDHLIITAFREDGNMISKISCLFTGEKFKLVDKDKYTYEKKLILDGTSQLFTSNNILQANMIYENGKVVEATTYYENGNRNIFLTCKNDTLEGSYKIWFENDKLNLEGNYINNKKDGLFKLFDESGTLVREGQYDKGELISGEAVVADLLYENPRTNAIYSKGTAAFSEELKKRSVVLEAVKNLEIDYIKYFNLRLNISKQGNVSKIDINSLASDSEIDIIKRVFSNFSGFMPGKEEGVSVKSLLDIEVQLSVKGLELAFYDNDSVKDDIYFIVEEMPEFPGGEYAFRASLKTNQDINN